MRDPPAVCLKCNVSTLSRGLTSRAVKRGFLQLDRGTTYPANLPFAETSMHPQSNESHLRDTQLERTSQ